MDRKLGGLILLALAAFTTDAAARAKPDMEAITKALGAYADCVGAAVERYAPSDAAVADVMDAAEGACADEYQAMRDVIYADLRAILHDDRPAYDRANEMAAARKASVRSRGTAYLLDLRMKPAE